MRLRYRLSCCQIRQWQQLRQGELSKPARLAGTAGGFLCQGREGGLVRFFPAQPRYQNRGPFGLSPDAIEVDRFARRMIAATVGY